MKKLIYMLLALCMLTSTAYAALETDDEIFQYERDDGSPYTIYDGDEQKLFTIGKIVYVGDQYISGDNKLYEVVSIDDESCSGIASYIGQADLPGKAWVDSVQAQYAMAVEKEKKIAMYMTHGDESYVPTDGTQSVEGKGGIFDVAKSLKQSLEERGIEVIMSEKTHLPHDNAAYRRSRQTALDLLKENPAAILDIHRDGIPDPDEYKKTIDGEKASQVRLLVGRRNQNMSENSAFAKNIKAIADDKYPGLIKDIFIGKGNYNQELAPKSILLEFGTHTLEKERALKSTDMMANVLDVAVFAGAGGSDVSGGIGAANNDTGATQESGGSGSAIVWVLIAIAVGITVFALISTGSGSGMWEKIKRGTSEVTGGMIGKKPKDRK